MLHSAPLLHEILEGTVSIILFLIFLKANYIYSATNNKRMPIIAGGALAASILCGLNSLSAHVFPYDILSSENIAQSPQVLYALAARLVLSGSIFVSIISVFKTGQLEQKEKYYRLKTYIIFILIALATVIIEIIPNPFMSFLKTNKGFLLIESSGIIDQALYLLSASIYLDIRTSAKKSLLSAFTLGLLVLAIRQISFVNPSLPESYRIIAHVLKVIACLLIFFGLENFELKANLVKFRQELLAYFSIFLLFSYILFGYFAALIFNFTFPPYSDYVFLEFFLISMIIQYILATQFTKPIENIINATEKYNPKEKFETMPVLFNDEIGKLTGKLNDIILLSWNYDQELIEQQKIVQRAHEKEKILREIIAGAGKFNEHDQIYEYLLSKLSNIFDANRCIHLHTDKNNNLFVKNEFIKDELLESLLYQTVFSAEQVDKILPENPLDVTVINNISQEISDPELKEYFLNNKIQSCLIYETARLYAIASAGETEKIGLIILCCPFPKEWPPEETGFFKLVVDATSLVYVESRQRLLNEELKKTFLASLTHDLRSPLTAVQKALEVILLKKIGTSLEDFSEYLEDIYKTNEELLILINNMLCVSHYESGKFELDRENCNVSELLNSSVKTVEYLAKDQDSEIITSVQENLPEINADKLEIKRVLTNLISNAVKHNKRGTEINVSAKLIDNNIEISVHDNGKGIPENERPKIFQQYPSDKRKIATGLGLYIAKQIIDLHKGTIWFETEEGKGTTFYFTLPAANTD